MQKSMTKALNVAAITALLVLPACSNMSQKQQRMLSGAAIGTGVGAATGAVTGGSPVTGAAIGAGVGAAGGYLYDESR